MGVYRSSGSPRRKCLQMGLTKALPRQKHETFIQQLGLVDISMRLHHE
jgi:hypothetical protein